MNKERLRRLEEKGKHLASLLTIAQRKKKKIADELIRLTKDKFRTALLYQTESWIVEKVGNTETINNTYMDMVANGEISWDDEPWIIKEYRTIYGK